MVAKGWRKFPDDEPLAVKPLTTAGPQPWHERCRELRDDGYYMRAIAKELGITFQRVQKFLSPDSKMRGKIRQLEREKERLVDDPEYVKSRRSYVRRYMQQRRKDK